MSKRRGVFGSLAALYRWSSAYPNARLSVLGWGLVVGTGPALLILVTVWMYASGLFPNPVFVTILPWMILSVLVAFPVVGLSLVLISGWRRYCSEPVAAPPGNRIDWLTWAPFQPQIVREICRHMTPAERKSAEIRGGLYGLWAGATFAVPVSFGLIEGWYRTAISLAVVYVLSLPLWIRSQRRWLCQTAWAREQGIQPADVRRRPRPPRPESPTSV